jgi:hypothetical protein
VGEIDTWTDPDLKNIAICTWNDTFTNLCDGFRIAKQADEMRIDVFSVKGHYGPTNAILPVSYATSCGVLSYHRLRRVQMCDREHLFMEARAHWEKIYGRKHRIR